MKLTALTWAVTYLMWLFFEGDNCLVSCERLHHFMSRKELKRFFAVDNSLNVPEYNVTIPYRVTEKGEFQSYFLGPEKTKRTMIENEANHDEVQYKIDALHEHFHIHVRRNKKFMAHGLQLETRDQYGRRIRRALSKTTHYLVGKLLPDPNSLVALSISDGMTGFLKRSNDTFVIYALPPHLAKHANGTHGGKPHLIYRKTVTEHETCENLLSSSQYKKGASTYADEKEHRDKRPRQLLTRAGLISKYLEVALLADEQVVASHGEKAEEFLLLIASIVNAIFQDRTAGDIRINYVVSRLIFITNKELGIDPSDSRISHVKVVQKLGTWARANNRDNQSDPLQFDVASLIRSGPIGGVAPVLSNICYRKDLVNVQGDNGLQTAYLIAHETGHNLHLNHDGRESCPNYVNIMSSVQTSGPKSLEWSSCSRRGLQYFLSRNESWCLDDPPSPTRPTSSPSTLTKLPGQLVDADKQCLNQYGTGYSRCVQREGSCEALYCTQDGYRCKSRLSRPLEGTACGKRKWCIRGSCVDNGLPKIHGGWSEWSEFTECSPPCDGGLRHRHRSCTNPQPQNGGEGCVGESKAFWEICNANVTCPESQTEMRDQQCRQFDENFAFHQVQGANPCHLACKLASTYSFYGNVKDGSRCNHLDASVYDVCLDGECQEVGCDHVLWSGKFRDRCGLCDGNGNSCTVIASYYTKVLSRYGYHAVDTIVVLPVGSTHVVFEEKTATYNLLGVQDENGTNLIPIPSWWGKVFYAAGTKITYINNVKFPDRIEIDGPINTILKIVFVQVWEQNVGIKYHYLRPLEAGVASLPLTCTWMMNNWTNCLEGQQKRDVFCMRTDNDTGEEYQSYASENCCGKKSKPDTVKLCPLLLEYRWHSEWEACSKTCGNGSQSKSIVCRAKVDDTQYKKDESGALCDSTLKPVAEFRRCNDIKCPAQWTTTWSECSQLCLPGERTTILRCLITNEAGEREDVADIQCEYEPGPFLELSRVITTILQTLVKRMK
ncbi:A disintegrin and metalloproteinase with thrombospondin motifs 6-like [Montipora capricornis]|uniref:A disintegrin and metalloproteinase with thrombospondin motifs 6-like n=1 Tax=Montipora capricornis TaxID=246305 RepID=UPI0035F13412